MIRIETFGTWVVDILDQCCLWSTAHYSNFSRYEDSHLEEFDMPSTVEQGFTTLHGKLTPTVTETEAAKRHRISIETCLKNNFEITRFFRAGSFGNGTNVRGYSDVDCFASIPTKHLTQNSQSTLTKVWRVLDERFPNTRIGIRGPVIWLPFGTDASESTDVVPADFVHRDTNGNHIYEIADRQGGWMRTSPDAHNNYVDEINKKLGLKVKPLIRFIKAWKYFKNVPIYSFYLEMQVARYASKESSIVYSIDVERIFNLLWNNQLADMQDPKGISGYIHPCFSDVQKTDALSKLQTALGRAQKARDAESAEDIKSAYGWWGLVFDGKFPAY